MKKIMTLVLLAWGASTWAAPTEQLDRNESQYNNQYAIVLNGYDPVSYFPEGGGVPIQGNPQITQMFGTRIYHFASEENRALFIANPLKFEPTYGSWCAYAMAQNSKIRINPLIFTVSGNRIHFFVSNAAKARFDGEVAGHESAADINWKAYSGEEPRNPNR